MLKLCRCIYYIFSYQRLSTGKKYKRNTYLVCLGKYLFPFTGCHFIISSAFCAHSVCPCITADTMQITF